MNAWDLAGIAPTEMVAFLKSCGLNACNLGFSYHGGRMLLPRHHQHKIYEQNLSALYFPADAKRYAGFRLQPHVAPEAKLIGPFIAECVKADFEVNAWIVLCHNDRLGMDAPECCIENVFGDKYIYALCPSNPEVRRYIVALCADIAAFNGVAKLDLEALSFMGYEHASVHDKRGVPLTPTMLWLLSICMCLDCRRNLGSVAGEVKAKACSFISSYLETLPDENEASDLRVELEAALGTDALVELLEMRRLVLTSLLEEIRAVTKPAHLNLRLATSPLFCGGKTAIPFSDLAGRVDSVTTTFLGASKENMSKELAGLPSRDKRFVPLYGGLMFHHPDCRSEADVRERVAMLEASRIDDQIFYGFSMAATKHFAWLRNVLMKE